MYEIAYFRGHNCQLYGKLTISDNPTRQSGCNVQSIVQCRIKNKQENITITKFEMCGQKSGKQDNLRSGALNILHFVQRIAPVPSHCICHFEIWQKQHTIKKVLQQIRMLINLTMHTVSLEYYYFVLLFLASEPVDIIRGSNHF